MCVWYTTPETYIRTVSSSRIDTTHKNKHTKNRHKKISTPVKGPTMREWGLLRIVIMGLIIKEPTMPLALFVLALYVFLESAVKLTWFSVDPKLTGLVGIVFVIVVILEATILRGTTWPWTRT